MMKAASWYRLGCWRHQKKPEALAAPPVSGSFDRDPRSIARHRGPTDIMQVVSRRVTAWYPHQYPGLFTGGLGGSAALVVWLAAAIESFGACDRVLLWSQSHAPPRRQEKTGAEEQHGNSCEIKPASHNPPPSGSQETPTVRNPHFEHPPSTCLAGWYGSTAASTQRWGSKGYF